MSVDETTKRRLLAEAKEASDRVYAARAEVERLAEERRAAIQAAMDAGIPRQEIADMLGIHRSVLYQILERGR